MEKLNVGVVGGTGYTGVELLRLLARHPQVRVRSITSRKEAGQPVADLFPSLRGWTDLSFEDPADARLEECDVVFFATPNGVAMEQARRLLEAGCRVIDLAADFRLRDVPEWEHWYGVPHADPELVAEAVYGLPERFRDDIRQARLVANPGCYPTAVQLALMPLLRAGAIDPGAIIADCKSGVSGAGRGAQVRALYAESSDSFQAYGATGHRHWPEIRQGLSGMGGQAVGLTFIPHLVPMIRGILASIYVRPLGSGLDARSLLEDAYRDEPFVDVLPDGGLPETRSVRGSNLCRVAVARPAGEGVLLLLAVIDNLVKGASGQAVQNMNIMFGLPETMGLELVPLLP